MTYIMVIAGEGNISYLFATARLGMDVSTYAYYSAATVVAGVVGSIAGFTALRSCLSEVSFYPKNGRKARMTNIL